MKNLLAICTAALLLAATTVRAEGGMQARSAEKAEIFEFALAVVERGLERNPPGPHLRMLKGHYLAQLGRTEEAIETFRQLTREFPEFAEARQVLAQLGADRTISRAGAQELASR